MPILTLAQLLRDQYYKTGRRDGQHYARGIKAGREHNGVTVADNNVWGGQTRDGGCTSSYEKIGYHAGSVDFILGVLDSGCPVRAYYDGQWYTLVEPSQEG